MRRALAIALLTALLAAGCGSAQSGAGSGGAGSPGIGPDTPVSHDPPPPGSQPPGFGGATRVIPRAGAGHGYPVRPVGLRVGVGDDGRAWARVKWWGGIPSCYVLRPVRVHRSSDTITLALREGSDAPPGTACAEIAMLKAVLIDLGQLPPGSYTVVAGGRRATLTV
ncbi:MAG: hypothetical protein QOJ31_464 [Gaiellales bacterium]|nr:hypothetical protein [Gaiellales bacterium]